MSRILVIHAHPYPRRSRAGAALLSAVRDMPELGIHSLYDRYPDFAIDVKREQRALKHASVIVWQAPFYWYGVPSLLSHWFEKVLVDGFAYGPGGDALSGKLVQWVATTGTDQHAYEATGMHHHRFDAFVPPIEETARFCGMQWQAPIVVHGAHRIGDEALASHARDYRLRLDELSTATAVPMKKEASDG